MTREEFTAGWLLLTLQPWARKYANQDQAAKLQFEFYWSRIGRGHGEAWKGACQMFAGGEKWPSVDELKAAMNHSLPPRLQLTTTADQTEKPEILVKIEAYQKDKGCTVLDAAEIVLPIYAKEHPEPEADADLNRCERLIKQLKAHRAHVQVMAQERAQNQAS